MSFDTDPPSHAEPPDHPSTGATTPTLARLATHAALNAARFAFSVVGAAITAVLPMQPTRSQRAATPPSAGMVQRPGLVERNRYSADERPSRPHQSSRAVNILVGWPGGRRLSMMFVYATK